MYVRTEPTTHCVCSLKTKHVSRPTAPSRTRYFDPEQISLCSSFE